MKRVILTGVFVFFIIPTIIIGCSPFKIDQVFVVDASTSLYELGTLFVIETVHRGSIFKLTERSDDNTDPYIKVDLRECIPKFSQNVGLIRKFSGRIFPNMGDALKYRLDQVSIDIKRHEFNQQKLFQQFNEIVTTGVVDLKKVQAIEHKPLKLGMTKEQVRLSLGEPDKWKRSASDVEYDTWLYHKRFALLYFHNGILASFEEGNIPPYENLRREFYSSDTSQK
jgi:hypothetical protein